MGTIGLGPNRGNRVRLETWDIAANAATRGRKARPLFTGLNQHRSTARPVEHDPRRQQRVLGPGLDIGEDKKQDDSRHEKPDREGIAPRRGLRVREAEDEREQPPGHQEEAGQVQRVMVSPLVVCQPERRADDGARSEQKVDKERPPPCRVGSENATEEEPKRATRAGDGAVDPKGPSSLIGIGERRGQERQHGRGEQRPERALDGAGNDEHREIHRGTPDG
jgi:hypothetical protein